MDPCERSGHAWTTLSRTVRHSFVPDSLVMTIILEGCKKCNTEWERTYVGIAVVSERLTFVNGSTMWISGSEPEPEPLSREEVNEVRAELKEQLVELGPATKTVEVPVDAYETNLGIRCPSGWGCRFLRGDALIEDKAAHYTVKGLLWHEPHQVTEKRS